MPVPAQACCGQVPASPQAKQQAGEKGCGCSQHMAGQAAALGRRWGSTGGADGTHATAGLARRSHIEHAALEAHRRGEHLRRTGGLTRPTLQADACSCNSHACCCPVRRLAGAGPKAQASLNHSCQPPSLACLWLWVTLDSRALESLQATTPASSGPCPSDSAPPGGCCRPLTHVCQAGGVVHVAHARELEQLASVGRALRRSMRHGTCRRAWAWQAGGLPAACAGSCECSARCAGGSAAFDAATATATSPPPRK